MTVLFLFVIMGFGVYTGPDCSVASFNMWCKVEAGYYFFNLIFVYAYYKNLV